MVWLFAVWKLRCSFLLIPLPQWSDRMMKSLIRRFYLDTFRYSKTVRTQQLSGFAQYPNAKSICRWPHRRICCQAIDVPNWDLKLSHLNQFCLRFHQTHEKGNRMEHGVPSFHGRHRSKRDFHTPKAILEKHIRLFSDRISKILDRCRQQLRHCLSQNQHWMSSWFLPFHITSHRKPFQWWMLVFRWLQW